MLYCTVCYNSGYFLMICYGVKFEFIDISTRQLRKTNEKLKKTRFRKNQFCSFGAIKNKKMYTYIKCSLNFTLEILINTAIYNCLDNISFFTIAIFCWWKLKNN